MVTLLHYIRPVTVAHCCTTYLRRLPTSRVGCHGEDYWSRLLMTTLLRVWRSQNVVTMSAGCQTLPFRLIRDTLTLAMVNAASRCQATKKMLADEDIVVACYVIIDNMTRPNKTLIPALIRITRH